MNTVIYLVILGIALGGAGCKPAPKPPVKATTQKPGASATAQTNATSFGTNRFLPVFTNDPKTGRDPFFPNSARRGIPAAANTNTAIRTSVAPRPSVLVLKGIMGPASRRVAFINDQELAEGDEAMFMLGGVETRVRCLRIQANSVEVAVGETGERKVLPLN